MLEILRVVRTISRSRVVSSCLLSNASVRAPMPPTPAASVGVASPARIEPSTAKISNKGGSSALSTCHTDTLSSSDSRAGMADGLITAITIK